VAIDYAVRRSDDWPATAPRQTALFLGVGAYGAAASIVTMQREARREDSSPSARDVLRVRVLATAHASDAGGFALDRIIRDAFLADASVRNGIDLHVEFAVCQFD
jgi:hypothetical protein